VTNDTDEKTRNTGKHALLRVYLKDASLTCQRRPLAFTSGLRPVYDIELEASSVSVEGALWEVSLDVRVESKLADDTQLYSLTVAQHGLFHAEGHSPDILQTLLNVHFPAMLYDYARECVDNLVVSAGYPPLKLAPRNFSSLAAEGKSVA